jgi:hypothetical protein
MHANNFIYWKGKFWNIDVDKSLMHRGFPQFCLTRFSQASGDISKESFEKRVKGWKKNQPIVDALFNCWYIGSWRGVYEGKNMDKLTKEQEDRKTRLNSLRETLEICSRYNILNLCDICTVSNWENSVLSKNLGFSGIKKILQDSRDSFQRGKIQEYTKQNVELYTNNKGNQENRENFNKSLFLQEFEDQGQSWQQRFLPWYWHIVTGFQGLDKTKAQERLENAGFVDS